MEDETVQTHVTLTALSAAPLVAAYVRKDRMCINTRGCRCTACYPTAACAHQRGKHFTWPGGHA